MSPSRIAYRVALGGYFGLFLLLMAWTTWLAPPQHFPVALVLLLLVGPLLFPLRGLLHGRPYTFAWTSFLALAYFVHGVGEAFASPAERELALLEVFFSTLLYVGAVTFARLRGRELKGLSE